MNAMIKRIEINPASDGHAYIGQSLEIWIDPTDSDLVECWRDSFDNNCNIRSAVYVDYRKDFTHPDDVGEDEHWKTLPAPCVIFLWAKPNKDIIDEVFVVLRAEPDKAPTAEEIKTWWIK